ncbi:MAG: Rpn family recombination-promoting nuclease/putative transposase [Ruminococcus flavefaciens]|nr:Rpn family recombination-promoting nuclease/putative transposase [Ruminococcus flavefaciens]
MAKKTQDLKPDTVLKNYWSDNEQFADLFNAVLFDGRPVIKAEELEDVDTEESTVLEHREYAESIKASRDNIKIQKKSSVYGVQFVLLGLESQEHIHYAMPMRVMGYDYGSYKKQYDSNAKKYKEAQGMSEDEYLSRMKKTDKLIPVITVVIYYGEKPWDGAKSLHEMLDIPSEMVPYVNDYKMLLVEARQNDLTLHNINNIDLFNLLNILLDKSRTLHEARQTVIDYAKEHEVDKSVVMTVAGAANCKIDYNAQKGDLVMWTVFEETKLEGKIEGIIKMLRKYRESDDNILKELMSELGISEDEAEEYLDKYNKGVL